MVTRGLKWRRRRRGLFVAGLMVAGGSAISVLLGPIEAGLFVAAALLTWMLTPYTARWARRLDAVVHPGGRGIHTRTTPLAGGLAIFLALLLLLPAAHWIPGSLRHLTLLMGAVLIVGVGLIDDVRNIGPRWKILAQAIAGVILVIGGWRLDVLSITPTLEIPLGGWGGVVIVGWVICATNAFNLIDGIDGLCTSLAACAAVAAVVWGADASLGVVTAGACLGFLRHNLPVARSFLGDGGSQLLGYSVAVLALTLPTSLNVPLALALVAYPAGDVALSVARRAIRAKPLFVGDSSHVHHKVLHHLGSTRKTLAAILGFALVHLALAHLWPGVVSLSLSLALWVGLAATLLLAGHVGLPRMLRNRRSFRRLHALRNYVEELLNVSTAPKDVHRALTRFASDLDLVELHMSNLGSIHVNGQSEACERVELPLRHARASWSYVPSNIEPALDRELRAVVCEVMRKAQSKLLRMSRRESLDDQGGGLSSRTADERPSHAGRF